MSILNLIASEGFITVNKTLIKLFGLEAALILGELAGEEMYWEHTGKSEDGFFYSTAENLEENTGLTRYQQDKAIKKLEQAGILDTVVKGMPATKHFKFNQERIFEIIAAPDLKNLKTSFEEICNKSLKNFETCSQKTLKHVCKKLEANNNKKNNNKKITNKNNNMPVLKSKAAKGVCETEKQFNELWAVYPNKQGKQKALMSYKKAVKSGVTFDEIMQGLQNYRFYIEQKGVEQQYIKHGSTWFGQRGWEDDYTITERVKKPRNRNINEMNNEVFVEFLKGEDLTKPYESGFECLTEVIET